jgi:hypothetical protein
MKTRWQYQSALPQFAQYHPTEHAQNCLLAVAFRGNICFWAAIVLFWFVLGVLPAFECVRLPSP